MRFLPNPHFVEGLRPLDGRDQRVREFVLGHDEARELLERLRELLRFLLPFYQREGKAYLDGRDRLHRRPPSLRDLRRGAARTSSNRSATRRPSCTGTSNVSDDPHACSTIRQ